MEEMKIISKRQKRMKHGLFIILWGVMLCGVNPSLHAQTVRAVTDDYPPYIYRENGKPMGIAIEIAQALFTEANIEGTIEFFPWTRAYEMGVKIPNVLVFTMSRTPEREALFHWIGPVFSVTVGLYKLNTRTDIEVTTLEDARQHTIGTVMGYASEKELLKAGFEIGKQIDQVKNEQLNVAKFLAGRFDLICSTDLVLASNLRQAGHDFHEVEKVVTLEGQFDEYMGVNIESDDAIVEQLQTAFERMKQHGAYDRIISKYTP